MGARAVLVVARAAPGARVLGLGMFDAEGVSLVLAFLCFLIEDLAIPAINLSVNLPVEGSRPGWMR